jgi:hypothetical protein
MVRWRCITWPQGAEKSLFGRCDEKELHDRARDGTSCQTGKWAYMSVLDDENARRLDQRQDEVLEERAHLDGPQLRGRDVLHGLGIDLQQPLDARHERVGRLLQGRIGH